MISCVYTADKERKRKRWMDGFVKAENGRMTVYNEEKRVICSFCSKVLQQEYETPRYIVYIENYEQLETQKKERSAEEMVKIIDTILKRDSE